MNTLRVTLIALAISIGGWASSAQQPAVPFKQLERDAQLSRNRIAPGSEIASNHSSSSLDSSSLSTEVTSSELSAAGFVRVYPTAALRILSTSYFMLNGMHLGMAIFDVEMTQHCIADQHCREGNPIMPSSQAGMLGVNFALVGYGSFVSYKLKKRGSKMWTLSPIVGSAAHGVGVASGFMHR
jgi:hypothetical protein